MIEYIVVDDEGQQCGSFRPLKTLEEARALSNSSPGRETVWTNPIEICLCARHFKMVSAGTMGDISVGHRREPA